MKSKTLREKITITWEEPNFKKYGHLFDTARADICFGATRTVDLDVFAPASREHVRKDVEEMLRTSIVRAIIGIRAHEVIRRLVMVAQQASPFFYKEGRDEIDQLGDLLFKMVQGSLVLEDSDKVDDFIQVPMKGFKKCTKCGKALD